MNKFQQKFSKWLGCLNKKYVMNIFLELDFAKKCTFGGFVFHSIFVVLPSIIQPPNLLMRLK